MYRHGQRDTEDKANQPSRKIRAVDAHRRSPAAATEPNEEHERSTGLEATQRLRGFDPKKRHRREMKVVVNGAGLLAVVLRRSPVLYASSASEFSTLTRAVMSAERASARSRSAA